MSAWMVRLLPIIAAIFFLFYLGWMLRSRRLKQTYLYIWFIIGIGLLVIAIWPRLLFWASDLLGFQRASNMILVAASFILLIISIQLSTAVSGLQEDRRRLVEEIAILDARVLALEQTRAGEGQPQPGTASDAAENPSPQPTA